MTTQDLLPVRIEGLDEYQAKILEHSTVWLKNVRQRAVSQFASLGLPSTKDEEFKYTSLSDLASRRFQVASTHRLVEEDKLNEYLDPQDINVVLINGVLWGDLSGIKQLPEGLEIMTFTQASQRYPSEVEATIAKVTSNDPKALLAMNMAMFLDGVFIKLAAGVKISKLIHIVHVTSGVEENTVVFPRVLVHVQDEASLSILESHVGYGILPYWSNSVLDMRIGQAASVQYCKAENESRHAFHTSTSRIWQEKDSALEIFSFAQRASLVRNNLSVMLKGENTNTIMNGFYALDGKQHVDNHTLLDIQQPNCTSYQLYKGILNDASRAVFNGKIYVHADAQKTNGYQLNKHLLLGKDARVDTKPQLEIFADDVKCTHGATIGQLSEEEVFYLQSRCVKKEIAIALLSRGFIDDIIGTIKDAAVRAKLSKLLEAKFPEVKL